MGTILDIATVAALVGDPARANMLCALLGGQALTAKELAFAARVSPQTTSGHLAKLSDARLVVAVQQGRFRYYRLAGPKIAHMLESIMNVAALLPPRARPLRMAPGMRTARLCYDHCAGLLGVGIADALQDRGFIELSDDGGVVTLPGTQFLAEFGVDIEALRRHRRVFCGPCLDWSERRPHLAGAVGAGIAQRLFALGWIERVRATRELSVTPTGAQGLRQMFGLTLGEPGEATRPRGEAV
ncbi:MAG: helix-turn-helix transcriptional regulator [Rhizobiales bacterium]|nr:helix-turn-helix transcriptional regulator [Hyphomicrobiales bacterium]